MRKISLAICFGFVFTGTLGLQGCKHPSTYNIAINMRDDPRSLDPREVRLLSDISLIKHLYEGLVQENVITGDIEPALAKSYSLSSDGKACTFHLKEAFWSNGDPITAQDFIDSWKQVVIQKVTGVYASAFEVIKNVRKIQRKELGVEELGVYAIDDKTLVVELEAPTFYFLKLLALPVFSPVHKNQREGVSSLPVTSGAFSPKELKPRQHLLLEKNPYYYDQNEVKADSITVHFISDPNTAALLFNQGKLHWQGPPWGEGIPTETMSHLRSKGHLHSLDVAGTSWLIFNANTFPLHNIKMRKALSMALDKSLLVSTAFLDRAKPAEHIIPQCLHSYPNEEDGAVVEQRKQNAKALFQEALSELNITAKDLEKLSLEFSATSSASRLIGQMIREQWKEVLGFSIPIVGKEFALLQTDLSAKQFSIATGGWFADFADPMSFLNIFTSRSGLPHYAVSDQNFDKAVEQIQKEEDEEKRKELISEASLYLERLHIIEPIYHDSFHFAVQENLVNFDFSPTGVVDFRYIRRS